LLDDQTLIMEAGLALAAGADTTPTALTNALLELHTHPEAIACLRKEVDAAAALSSNGETDGEYLFNQPELAKMPYLNAVLQETLRLYPAVPSGARHVSPFAGILVAGRCVCCIGWWKQCQLILNF
jgi:cytochrome P450